MLQRLRHREAAAIDLRLLSRRDNRQGSHVQSQRGCLDKRRSLQGMVDPIKLSYVEQRPQDPAVAAKESHRRFPRSRTEQH